MELPGVKELDNVQVRDFRTSGEALVKRGASSEATPVAWRIYGETAQLRGKEYQLGGFRMDVAVPGQGDYVVSTPAAVFDVEQVAVHGEAAVELSGPGMRVVGLGFDLFTDAASAGGDARQLLFVIREAVQLELERESLRHFGHGEGDAADAPSQPLTLSAGRLTLQVTPDGEGGESGVATLEGNVLLRLPPGAKSAMAEHSWDGWELSGDRMLLFLSQRSQAASGGREVSWLERVEVSGHLRVETDGGRQRLQGDRGVFTTSDGRLTVDGNVLMMNQFSDSRAAADPRVSQWNLFFTSRATICFASEEERRSQRAAGRRESVLSRVELPGQVTMLSADASHHLVASRGEYSGEDGRVSLHGEVRGELRNPSAPGAGDYLLEGPQVDFFLEAATLEGGSGARIVFPQGMTLRQRAGGSRVKAGWASVEADDAGSRRVRIQCAENVLAELHGQDGQEHELFLSGDQMTMQLDFGEGKGGALDCIEWIELPERLTVWGRAKGISHRVGGDRGRYERSTRSIVLEENVVLALAQEASSGGGGRPEEAARVLARRATVRLEPSSVGQLTIASIDLAEDLVARTADFSVYVTAETAHYDYSLEELEMAGRVRAELSPGGGQRELRSAVVLDTSRVQASAGLQQVTFPEPLTLAASDQTIRLAAGEGLLDVSNQRIALGGGVRIAFASRRADARSSTEVGLSTRRVLVYLAEREAGRTGTGKSALAIDRIDLPEHLELYTADGRQRLVGDRGSYSALTNAVAVAGDVEARFAGEAFDDFAAGTGGFPSGGAMSGEVRRETEEMILNCSQVVARLRNEPLSGDDERGASGDEAARALAMLESLEIPGKVTLQSADGSRRVTADRCRYRQESNDITLDGDCRLEYRDERGVHAVDTPQVVFDCGTRTITTGVATAATMAPDAGSAVTPAASVKSGRTTITIPFASHPVENREPAGSSRSLRR